MEKSEAKPCPYCGHTVRHFEINSVMCCNPDCSNDAEMTLEQWNKRPIEEKLEEKNKNFRRTLGYIHE